MMRLMSSLVRGIYRDPHMQQVVAVTVTACVTVLQM